MKTGKRGGPRPNAGAKKGKPRSSKKKILDELISEAIATKCIKNLEKLANGGLLVGKKIIENGKEKKIEESYSLPDKDANMYLLDQKYGRPKQRQEITGADGEKLEIVITDFRNEK